jgi:hypothetical protein
VGRTTSPQAHPILPVDIFREQAVAPVGLGNDLAVRQQRIDQVLISGKLFLLNNKCRKEIKKINRDTDVQQHPQIITCSTIYNFIADANNGSILPTDVQIDEEQVKKRDSGPRFQIYRAKSTIRTWMKIVEQGTNLDKDKYRGNG